MTNGHGLGRLYKPDERDRRYGMQPHLPPEGTAVTRKIWPFRGPVLDQGQTGECVGHGWEHWLRTAPIETHMTELDAVAIYKAARVIDGDDPNDLQGGSSVRAGAKAIQARGQLATYVWAATLPELVAWVLSNGPVVMGSVWYDSMFAADAHGMVTIAPRSQVAGGHCYLLRGVDTAAGIATFLNSWGPSWAQHGHFTMSFETLDRLLREQGEACSAIQTKVVPKA